MRQDALDEGSTAWWRAAAADAVRATTQYGFTQLGLVRVFAVPFANNPASARLLEKAGYTLEGRMRRSAIKDGEVLEQLLYACVSEALAPKG